MNINKAVLKFVKLGITIIIALLIVYVTVSISLTAFDFGYRVFTEPAMEEGTGKEVVVTIEETMDDSDIGKELENKGLVRNGTLFMIQLKLSAYAEDILPGTYILNTSMTAKDIMMVMSTPQEKEEESEEESETTTESETETGSETNTAS